MSFTKGPWELRENIPYDTGGWVVFHGRFAENRTICRLPYGNVLPCPDTEERRENTANAHLIAAAPELLEALDELVGMNEKWNADVQSIIGRPPTWTEQYMDRAKAALRKARGE